MRGAGVFQETYLACKLRTTHPETTHVGCWRVSGVQTAEVLVDFDVAGPEVDDGLRYVTNRTRLALIGSVGLGHPSGWHPVISLRRRGINHEHLAQECMMRAIHITAM